MSFLKTSKNGHFVDEMFANREKELVQGNEGNYVDNVKLSVSRSL